MAIFLPGPAIAEARGSIGGTVFSRNRHGAYMRNRVKPVNPNTERQANARLRVEQLQQHWRETLTDTERKAWEDYAKGTPTLNALGQSTILSGVNMYIRTNSLYLQAGGTRIDTAPPTNGVAALPSITYDSAAATGIRVTAISPAPIALQAMLFFISPPKATSVNFFGRGYVFTTVNLGVMAANFVVLGPAFTAVGQKFFIEARSVTPDGRPSERFQQNVIMT